MQKLALLAGAALIAFAPAANALTFSAVNSATNSVLPPDGGTNTVIALQGVSPVPSQTTINGTGYTITFTGLTSNQGVVQGSASNVKAIPVAGTSGGQPTYLTGDYLSPQTTDPSLAGKYLSTGGTGATITISFSTPQQSLALLWGSVDASNLITLSNGETLTGTQILGAASINPAGSQGIGGSAYVSLSSTDFSSVSFSSGVISFESAGIIASTPNRATVPEPMSIALLGMGLAGLGMIRRRV